MKIKCVRGPLDGTIQETEDGINKVEWRRFETTALASDPMAAVPTVRSFTYRLSDEVSPDGEKLAYFMYEK